MHQVYFLYLCLLFKIHDQCYCADLKDELKCLLLITTVAEICLYFLFIMCNMCVYGLKSFDC